MDGTGSVLMNPAEDVDGPLVLIVGRRRNPLERAADPRKKNNPEKRESIVTCCEGLCLVDASHYLLEKNVGYLL